MPRVRLASRDMALFEDMLPAPASGPDYGRCSAAGVGPLQELISRSVFMGFSSLRPHEPLRWSHRADLAPPVAAAWSICKKWYACSAPLLKKPRQTGIKDNLCLPQQSAPGNHHSRRSPRSLSPQSHRISAQTCPFGSIQKGLHKIAGATPLKRYQFLPPKWLHDRLKWIKYAVFFGLWWCRSFRWGWPKS